MKNKTAFFFSMVLAIMISFMPKSSAFAEENPAFYADGNWQYQDPNTGYIAIIWDDADLLSDAEEELLIKDMIPITASGHVVFSSDYQEEASTDRWAEEVLRNVCDKGESGTIFEIDMTNRQIFIYSDGEINNTVTTSYAYSITDNVYTYAVDGRYYECAAQAFGQIFDLLEGRGISQPMKHINNALLAIAFGILINFILLNVFKKKNNKNTSQESIVFSGNIKNLNVVPGHLTKVYKPKSSSGGGGSGGGGGGGRSGGGGGHSF